MLGYVSDCYVREALVDSYIVLLAEQIEKYEVRGGSEQGRVEVSSNERSRYVQNYCFTYYAQVKL